MRGSTTSSKYEDSEKKHTAFKTTLHYGHRNLLIWCLLIMSMLYIIYSSNLFFNDEQDCSTTTSTEEHLSGQLLPITNMSSLSNNTQLQEQMLEPSPPPPVLPPPPPPPPPRRFDTEVNHIVFCIAGSSNLWEQRKEYIKQWWRPKVTRGMVWLDKPVRTRRNEGLPEIKISGSTRKLPYTNRQGDRSALRISRIISETVRLGLEDVRWFVMGDDDTVFVVDNVIRVLSKYNHSQFYYVGSSSESHLQNIYFSYNMAYGGGGFAISYPLAMELEKMQDKCIKRYPALYGSDDRIQACMAEMGVPLTKEVGFHQYDVYGNLLGLLGAHPVAPFVSLHHLDVVEPLFPGMSRAESIHHLFQSINSDSSSVMQQSICYDTKRSWSISVSWGYVVQISRGIISPRELQMPTRTFLNWYVRADYTAYAFNTRPLFRHPCEAPIIFCMHSVRYNRSKKQTVGVYYRHKVRYPHCRWKTPSPATIDSVVVIKRPDPLRWQRSPRRDCCRVVPSKKSSTMYISVGRCRDGEVSNF